LMESGVGLDAVIILALRQRDVCQAFLDECSLRAAVRGTEEAERPEGLECGAAGEATSCGRLEDRTTCMLTNLPNELTRDELVQLLNRRGFEGKFGFLYLLFDFKTERNVGYAFVDMWTCQGADELFEHFQGFRPDDWPEECVVRWATKVQGRAALVEGYRNNPVMHGSVPDKFKPVLFDEGGKRVPFPAQTKSIKKPRPKYSSDSVQGTDRPVRTGDEKTPIKGSQG